MTENVEFTLSDELDYHHGGELKTTNMLYLRPPKPKDKKQVFRMRRHFFAAITGMTKKVGDIARQETPKEEAMTGAEILAAFYMSGIDMERVHDDFLKLITCDGVCKLGAAPLTRELYDKIDGDDVDNLLGEYFAVFFVSSWMDGLNPPAI
jgi:hypothetical protein